MATVTKEADYRVRQADVFLSLAIGEGQNGSTEVFLGTTKLLSVFGDIGGLRIGKGSDVANKKLIVRSIINDVMSNTNRMSITYTLSGGAANKEVVSSGEVAQNGSPLRFRTTINLLPQATR
jgi:hypothetical protein